MKKSWKRPPCLYGNWCGPGCSGPDSPIDDVDDCCRKHDRCYDEKGYFSRSCDRKLCKCLRPQIDRKTKKGRAAALIYSYYSLGRSDMKERGKYGRKNAQ